MYRHLQTLAKCVSVKDGLEDSMFEPKAMAPGIRGQSQGQWTKESSIKFKSA